MYPKLEILATDKAFLFSVFFKKKKLSSASATSCTLAWKHDYDILALAKTTPANKPEKSKSTYTN